MNTERKIMACIITPDTPRFSSQDCYVYFVDQRLVIGNSRIERVYEWNDGNLITNRFQAPNNGTTVMESTSTEPDLSLPGIEFEPAIPEVGVEWINGGRRISCHLRLCFQLESNKLRLKRTIRIYPNCPAIGYDLEFQGTPFNVSWIPEIKSAGKMQQLEREHDLREQCFQMAVMDRVRPGSWHISHHVWQLFDITDRRNTLTQVKKVYPYKCPQMLEGNILFMMDNSDDVQMFMLKEGPCSDVQLANPGCDFVIERNSTTIAGIGLEPSDLVENQWVRGYSWSIGLSTGRETDLLWALRDYQHRLRPFCHDHAPVLVANTWGDRNRDATLNEKFVLHEIDALYELGITHLQLDDGWQFGRSGNSAFAGGSFDRIWDNDAYWSVHPERFPHGLEPIIEYACHKQIEIGLWFNPSSDNSYENWEKDAVTILGLYRSYGIKLFKIDGLDIDCKLSESRLRNMFKMIQEGSGDAITLNLDITAKRRFGYFHFHEFGNLFLENRYTDNATYFPHMSLRNLWTLAHVVPPQWLQIEFLNIWRNSDQYPEDDPLAPANVPFEYCFAICMMAQPLAWFEASGLPKKALEISSYIKTYKSLQPAIHQCHILPIGSMPTGYQWTGFIAIGDEKSYLIIYREYSKDCDYALNLDEHPGLSLDFKEIFNSNDMNFHVDISRATIHFHAEHPFSFILLEASRHR